MFESIPTEELTLVKEQLNGEEFELSRRLIERELSKRAMSENFDQSALLEALRNDISGIYDAIDETQGAKEHPEDNRWI